MHYRFSTLVNWFEYNDKISIFHPITLELIFFSKKLSTNKKTLLNYIINDELLFDFCKNSMIIVEGNHNEHTYTREISEKNKIGDVDFSVLKMVMTTKCNLECDYCLIRKNLKNRCCSSEHLSLENAKKVIDAFSKYCIQSKPHKRSILLYGGEPLLNLDCLKFVINYIRKLENKSLFNGSVEIVLETNGTLVDNEIAEELKNNNVFSIVSIDGIKEVHDKYRKNHSLEGSWEKAISGYKLLKKHGVNSVISSVYSEAFSKERFKCIDFLANELKTGSIGLNLYHVIEKKHFEHKETLNLISKYTEIYDYSLNKGLHVEHIMRRIRPLINKKIRLIDCEACGHRIVSNEKAQFGICEGFLGNNHYYSNIDSLKKLKADPTFLSWAQRTPLTIKECQGCVAQGVCGGGCVYNAITLNKDIYAPDPYICSAAKHLVKWAIDKWSKEITLSSDYSILTETQRKNLLQNLSFRDGLPLSDMSKMSECVL